MLLKRTVFRKCTEVWLSLVERCVRDAEAAGSSPVTSIQKTVLRKGDCSFLCTIRKQLSERRAVSLSRKHLPLQ